jgi:hypothetical protein
VLLFSEKVVLQEHFEKTINGSVIRDEKLEGVHSVLGVVMGVVCGGCKRKLFKRE